VKTDSAKPFEGLHNKKLLGRSHDSNAYINDRRLYRISNVGGHCQTQLELHHHGCCDNREGSGYIGIPSFRFWVRQYATEWGNKVTLLYLSAYCYPSKHLGTTHDSSSQAARSAGSILEPWSNSRGISPTTCSRRCWINFRRKFLRHSPVI
jgi:hypothetical protein